jgi:FtsH-binding integral membrane protein
LAAFLLQVLPSTLLASAATLFGGTVVEPRLPGGLTLPFLALGVALFVAALVTREMPGWNLLSLVCFAAVAGGLLGRWLPPERAVRWTWAVLLAVGVMTAAAGIGSASRSRPPWVGLTLWAASWPYVAGWLVLSILDLGPIMSLVWALVGLVLFGGLTAMRFPLSVRGQVPALRAGLATELYLLGLNLVVAAQVFLTGLAQSPG